MADGSGRLGRTGDSRDAARQRRASRPYRPPVKVHFAMYATSVAMVMSAILMTVAGGHRTWTWIFPAAAMAGAIYGYLHVRSAKTLGQGSIWILVQVVCSLGAFALLSIPANY